MGNSKGRGEETADVDANEARRLGESLPDILLATSPATAASSDDKHHPEVEGLLYGVASTYRIHRVYQACARIKPTPSTTTLIASINTLPRVTNHSEREQNRDTWE